MEISVLLNLKPCMSYYNGHDKELVDKINLIGNHPTRKFFLSKILYFLTNAYNSEVENLFGVKGPYTQKFVDTFSYEILTHICDDNDLLTIISFCRINHLIKDDIKYHKNREDLIKYFNQSLLHPNFSPN